MKNLIFLLLLCSCSTIQGLYDDVMTPEEVVNETPQPKAIITPTVTYEDEVSKNWEYQRQLGNYIARTPSTDKKAVLHIVRDTTSTFLVGIQAIGTKMKYREGHSVEVKIDDQYSNQKVLPSDGDAIRFADSLELAKELKGKKELEVKVLNEEGPRTYKFEVSGLQDFFTTI